MQCAIGENKIMVRAEVQTKAVMERVPDSKKIKEEAKKRQGDGKSEAEAKPEEEEKQGAQTGRAEGERGSGGGGYSAA